MKLALALLAALLLPVTTASALDEGWTRSSTEGGVTVSLTLLPPVEPGVPIRVKVGLDTHSGSLDGIALASTVAIRRADGTQVAPSTVEQSGGGHHRQAVAVFPAQSLGDRLDIVVKSVSGRGDRLFTWALPLKR